MHYVFVSDEQYEIARKNGISRYNAYNRVWRLGWSIEDAITKPVGQKGFKRKYPIEYLEKAIKNGITNATFIGRVSRGMSYEEACTRPLMKRGRKQIK